MGKDEYVLGLYPRNMLFYRYYIDHLFFVEEKQSHSLLQKLFLTPFEIINGFKACHEGLKVFGFLSKYKIQMCIYHQSAKIWEKMNMYLVYIPGI